MHVKEVSQQSYTTVLMGNVRGEKMKTADPKVFRVGA